MITISLSAPLTRYAETRSSLMCSSMISFSTDPPPQDVIFEWFYGLNGNSLLPSGVTISATISINNTYISTLEFSPLLPSHTGNYTCQLRGYTKQVTAEISVIKDCESSIIAFTWHDVSINFSPDIMIGFEQSSYTVTEGYTVEVCFNATVQGSVNGDVIVNISTADNSTMGERNSQVLYSNYSAWLNIGGGDYTPIDMPLKINMSTTTMCVNISTIYDDNPMNMDEIFIVSLTSNDTKVFIPKESASTTVIIENSNICDFVCSFW